LIKKITDPIEFQALILDLEKLFGEDNNLYGHVGAKINAQSLMKAWSDSRLLNFNLHVWANREKTFDAVVMFQGVDNHVIGEKIWQEYLWLSKNPKAGLKLLNTALDFGRKLGYKRVIIGSVENHPRSKKVRELYKRKNWQKDSELYIGNL
jgi:hypothetical protein